MKLEPGESLCPYCENGKVMSTNQSLYCFVEECSFCKGKGKLDWVEQVLGVKEKPIKIKFNYFGMQVKFSDVVSCWKNINA